MASGSSGSRQRSFEDWDALREAAGVPKRGGHPSQFETGVAVPAWMEEALAAPNGGNLPESDGVFSRGGLQLHYRKWLPPDPAPRPRGAVVFQHGMGSHANAPALSRLGRAFAEAGLGCYMLDLQAHGYSESHGPPLQCVLDYNDMIADMERLVEIVVGELGAEVRLFVAGESLGGALAALLSLRMQQPSHPHHQQWAGFLGIAPAFDPALPPRLVETVLRCCCLPCCPRSTALSPPASGKGEGEEGPAGAMVLEACRQLIEDADPLSWKEKFPLVTGGTFIDLCREIKTGAHTLAGPFRILHGADDCVVFPSGSQQLIERSAYVAAELAAGRRNPVMMLPEGYRHCLLQDWCADAVVEECVAWCTEQLAASEPEPEQEHGSNDDAAKAARKADLAAQLSGIRSGELDPQAHPETLKTAKNAALAVQLEAIRAGDTEALAATTAAAMDVAPTAERP